jgi:hypothetical protein
MLRLKIPLGRFSTSLFDVFSKRDIVLELVSRIRKLTTPIAEIPLPADRTPISLQTATYFDGEMLHVWYGVSADGTSLTEDIFYTSAPKPFTDWATPVLVIPRPEGWGIRDPTSLITSDYVYLFVQAYDGTAVRSSRLYRIPRTADFTVPANYTYIGVIYDRGATGEFDSVWAASPVPVSLGGMTFCLYEAYDGTNYAIGLLYSKDVESVPYTRIGPVNSFTGEILRNPTSPANPIVPCNWLSPNSFFVHYSDGAYYHIGLAVGDIFANSFELIYPVDPNDGQSNHAAVAVVGVIDNYLYLIMQTWTPEPKRLKLFRVDISDLL